MSHANAALIVIDAQESFRHRPYFRADDVGRLPRAPAGAGRRRQAARRPGRAGVSCRRDRRLCRVVRVCDHAVAAADRARRDLQEAPTQRARRQRARRLADLARRQAGDHIRHSHRTMLRDDDAPRLRPRLRRRFRFRGDADVPDDRRARARMERRRDQGAAPSWCWRIASRASRRSKTRWPAEKAGAADEAIAAGR